MDPNRTWSLLAYFMSSPVFALSATLPSLRVVGRVNEQFAQTLLLSVVLTKYHFIQPLKHTYLSILSSVIFALTSDGNARLKV